ncbi:hypothetical protein EWX78_07385 [Campylobacter coli]|uniref:Uncharacterized protein n=1 Tax=Campylobacter coli TaxID=195 RepID=A0A644SA04_CAMCO|nr:hypothetical protein [Campylobacter coli]EAI5447080.1 hypothetical protein [Campylobacter coli]EAJ2630413.1 hypothetical protein [Campylobacter coli]EAJ9198218.1 hypothetical protein [Campylobacter coli]EAJ9411606.1 hypothetical protein [Campylobacter coli]
MSSRSVTNIINVSIDENHNKNISGSSFSSLYGQIGYNILIGIKTLAEDDFWGKYPHYKDFVEEIFVNQSNLLNQVDYEGTADVVFYKKNNKIFACVRCGVEEDNSASFSNQVVFDEKFIRETSFIHPISYFMDEYISREAIISIDKYIEYRYAEKPNETNSLIKEIVDNFVDFYKIEPLKPNFDFSKFDETLNKIIMSKHFLKTKDEF